MSTIRDFDKGMYRCLPIEDLGTDRWSLNYNAVFIEQSIHDDTKPGHNDFRLVQLLSMSITPHPCGEYGEDGDCGWDYAWDFFDFEAKSVDSRYCWAAAPRLYVFKDDGDDVCG